MRNCIKRWQIRALRSTDTYSARGKPELRESRGEFGNHSHGINAAALVVMFSWYQSHLRSTGMDKPLLGKTCLSQADGSNFPK